MRSLLFFRGAMKDLTIGHYLKEKRKCKGLSLKATSDLTKIHLSLLVHLEADDFENLPRQIYLKGFIRNLSCVLDFDSLAALDLLEKNYSSFTQQYGKRDYSPPNFTRFFQQLKDVVAAMVFMLREFLKLKVVVFFIISGFGLAAFFVLQNYFINQKNSTQVVLPIPVKTVQLDNKGINGKYSRSY